MNEWTPSYSHLAAHVAFLHFSHSQWLLCSATVATSLIAFSSAWPLIPLLWETCGGTGYKDLAAHLHCVHLHIPALPLGFNCEVGMLQPPPLECFNQRHPPMGLSARWRHSGRTRTRWLGLGTGWLRHFWIGRWDSGWVLPKFASPWMHSEGLSLTKLTLSAGSFLS